MLSSGLSGRRVVRGEPLVNDLGVCLQHSGNACGDDLGDLLGRESRRTDGAFGFDPEVG